MLPAAHCFTLTAPAVMATVHEMTLTCIERVSMQVPRNSDIYITVWQIT